MIQDPKVLKDVRMQYKEDGQIWRLVKEDDDGEMEEIVFTMMGTLWVMDLLPITRETTWVQYENNAEDYCWHQTWRNMKDKVCFLSQSVKVIRLGWESFGQTTAVLKEICQMGKREFKEEELQQWTPQTYPRFWGDRSFQQVFQAEEEDGRGHQHWTGSRNWPKWCPKQNGQ